MSSQLIITIIAAYFLVLLLISYFTGKNAGNKAFFVGNKQSPWYVVAFGMIGATLSGVTFISVPGWVVTSQFSYMQMVMGYLFGYFIIANVLMPLYYKLNLTSIYTYLEQRFGFYSYKTGAAFFLISRIIGSAFRLFLVANVLQITIFNSWNVPFVYTVAITILLIWLYTFRGGIKTIIWTDSLQTFFMLLSVGLSVYFISSALGYDFNEMIAAIKKSSLSKIFIFDDWRDKRFFFKQFISGAFIAIVMTGLDQDMMQKNLSCRNIKDAKKNMYWFSIILIPVNLLFMSLGVLLYIYAGKNGISIPEQTDDLFPLIATAGYLPVMVGISFILGLIAAAYSSADSALTALTTSFTLDILNTKNYSDKSLKKTRILVHIFISLALGIVIMIFKAINNENVISAIFRLAGYTYGPLLGLYSFGLFTKFKVKDKLVPLIAIISPLICYFLSLYSQQLFNGYQVGFELLILNGAITFGGLILIRKK
ncbi:MAG: sodium:solute symporter [Chlorobi bacterium]|nr:sodium:solute symporter [Chlorobiota bacterium]